MSTNQIKDLLDAMRIADSKESAYVKTTGVLYIFDMPADQLTCGQLDVMRRCGWLYDDNGNWSYDS